MAQIVLEPSIDDAITGGKRWMVVIYNNDTTPMEIVVDLLMTATGCDADEAYLEMWEAHHFGKAPVHFSTISECEKAAGIIASGGVKTTVEPEFID